MSPADERPGEQPVAPYLDAIVGYGFRGPGRFNVPGHKGGQGADPGLRYAIGEEALLLDVPADIYGVDIGIAPTPFQRAERLAAEAYGARRSWFLTNGATQGNHALCLALAPLGASVVAQRNSHASVVDGLVLSGGVPAFVHPEYDLERGMAHGVTPQALARVLAATPDAAAAFIVSPTYYGMAADVEACARVAHDAGVPLVVDQSWGAHFGFHPGLPPSALYRGADAVLTSTHKLAGSLTQSAILHLGQSDRIDEARLARAVRITRSTSPNSLLLGSLDAARRQLAVHGEQLLHETLQALPVAREKLRSIEGVSLLDDALVGQPGIAAYDPLRVVLDVRGTGRTGLELRDGLRQSFDDHIELATQSTMVFIVGMGETAARLLRMAGDVEEVVERMRRPGERTLPIRAPVEPPVMAVTPRTAFLGEAERVPVEDAVGRISCESIAGYPPGIPAILPGERLTAEIARYLRETLDSGGRLHGSSDPEFRSIHVLRER
ncbi:MAG TPA: amino acid decarboxylase [Solirubrobacteraceae bacterium]|nr:amino acid decarboxylase [Solirubrobacteraceae bacterium]